MDLAASMKTFDALRSLSESLSEDQSNTLNALPAQLALLLRGKATDQESVADAVKILEGQGSFQEKLLNLTATQQWPTVLGVFNPAKKSDQGEVILVPLLETLKKGGLCVECGAAQSVGALVGMDAESGLPHARLSA